MKGFIGRFAILAVVSAFFLTFADNVGAQMAEKDRVAIIKALKIKGTVGENSDGYLEFKGEKQASEVVEEENNIRRKAYESIAAQTNATAQKVGQQRAAQLAEESPKGTWIKSANGSWKQK